MSGTGPAAGQPSWIGRLRVPVVAAPMYMVSTPDLVVAACRAGIVGAIPAMNARSTAELAGWMAEMGDAAQELTRNGQEPAWGINLIGHSTNTRLHEDLAAVVAHRCPLVISSVGSPKAMIPAIHAYGGLVWSDVISVEQARKAVAAGVDGLVLVCAGAGGNTGWVNPLSFLKEVRSFFDGTVAVAGGISDGAQIRALRSLGADLAYLGTPFIAARESGASEDYKRAVAGGSLQDIVLSRAVSGIPANLLKESLERLGLSATDDAGLNVSGWRRGEAWSAGHAIGSVTQVESCASIVDRLEAQYRRASAGAEAV